MAAYREEEDPFEEDIVFDQAGLLNSASKMNTAIRRVSSGKCVLFAKTLGLCGAFFGLGLCIAIPGPTFLSPLTDLETSISPVSHIYVARTSGYVIGSIIGGVLFDRFNRLFLLFLSLLLTAVFITVTPWCQAVWLLETCMVILGITMGFLDTGGNVLCLDLWGRNSGPFMQALHFSFGLGAFVAPLLAAPFLEPTFANLSLSTEVTHTITEIPVQLHSIAPELYDSNRMKREDEALDIDTFSHSNDFENDSQQMQGNDILFPDTVVPTSSNPLDTMKSNGSLESHPNAQVAVNATISAATTTAKPKHKPSKTDGTKLGNTDWDKVHVRKPPPADLLPITTTTTTTPSLITSAATAAAAAAAAAAGAASNTTTVTAASADTTVATSVVFSTAGSSSTATATATAISSTAITATASSPVVLVSKPITNEDKLAKNSSLLLSRSSLIVSKPITNEDKLAKNSSLLLSRSSLIAPWTSHNSSSISSSHSPPVTISTTSLSSSTKKVVSASASTIASILTSAAETTAATTPRTTSTQHIPPILENSTDNYVLNSHSTVNVPTLAGPVVSTKPPEPESITEGFQATIPLASKSLEIPTQAIDSAGIQQEINGVNNKSVEQNLQSKNDSGIVGIPSMNGTVATLLSTKYQELSPRLESDSGNKERIIAEGLNMKQIKSDHSMPVAATTKVNLNIDNIVTTAGAFNSLSRERDGSSDSQDTNGRGLLEHGDTETASLRTRTSSVTDDEHQKNAFADVVSPVVYTTSLPVPKHVHHKPGTYDNDTEHINTIFDIFANRIEKYGFSKIQFSYLIVGIFVFSISLVFLGFLCHNPRDPKSKQEEGQGGKKITNKIAHRCLVSLMAMFFFLYMGLEVTYGQLVLAFSTRSSLQLAQSTGSVISVVFWGSFTAMRFASIFFAIGFSPVTMLILNFVFCTTGTILISALAAHIETALWVGTALIGVSLASVFPTGILWIERYIHVSNKVAAVFVIGVSLGETICPVAVYRLMVIEPMFFIHSALVINIMCILLFVVLWWLASRQGEKYSVINNNGYQLASQHDEEEDMMDMSPSGSGVVLHRHSFSSEHRALLNGSVHRGP